MLLKGKTFKGIERNNIYLVFTIKNKGIMESLIFSQVLFFIAVNLN